MQVATIEFARNVCGIPNANSTEFDQNSAEPVICLLEEQREVRKKGASMRLGTWPTKFTTAGSRKRFTEAMKCSSATGIVTSST